MCVWYSLLQEVYIFSGEIQAENHGKNIQPSLGHSNNTIHYAGIMNSLASDSGINSYVSTSGNPHCILWEESTYSLFSEHFLCP